MSKSLSAKLKKLRKEAQYGDSFISGSKDGYHKHEENPHCIKNGTCVLECSMTEDEIEDYHLGYFYESQKNNLHKSFFETCYDERQKILKLILSIK